MSMFVLIVCLWAFIGAMGWLFVMLTTSCSTYTKKAFQEDLIALGISFILGPFMLFSIYRYLFGENNS
jgi:hypothetical protein